jgi:Na+/melibiose symporter-like transporter
MTAVAAPAAVETPIKNAPASLPIKLFYGFGSVAFGIKDNGFQTFVLIFYSQIVGLPASWVGAAIFLALIIDAFMDPIVGQVSDHWRSKWGRRHPFMYAAAVPVAVSYLALWNPPHWSQGALFAYLMIVAIIVRTFITFYEIPSSALAPELTEDYDQRTSLLGYRYMFGWAGGLGMTFLAYRVFLQPTAQYPVGQLNPVGYSHYGTVSAVVMLLAILISAAGTHSRIPFLRQPAVDAPRALPALAREMASTLSHRSFLMMVGAGLFQAMGQGLNFALALYLGTFFWELSSAQLLILITQTFAGAVIAMALAPALSKRFGKKATAMVAFCLSVLIGTTPLMLRLLGFFPANHTPQLLPTLLLFGAFSSSLGISATILLSSMIADVVEDSELKTGRRSEGLFFSANSFVQKAVSGTGVMLSGLVLTLVHFPTKAQPGHIPQDVLRHLAMTYVPLYAGLYFTAMLFLRGYRIDRKDHHDNLRRLADAAAAAEVAEEAGGVITSH